MIIYGISESFHDASLTVLNNEEIVFAAHSERFSKIKNDQVLNENIINEALHYGYPDKIAFYEKPLLKNLRLLVNGGIKSTPPFFKNSIIQSVPVTNISHHYSHAAAGYFTSKFNDAVIVVLDAIGEFDTTTIWKGEGDKLKKVFAQKYPHSFGLFYSAFTHLVGLEPNKEEYILMGMAGYGNYRRFFEKVNSYFPTIYKQKYNFHKGINDWGYVSEEDKFDIAAAVQRVYELRLREIMYLARKITKKNKLVFTGGCALNCLANTQLWSMFDDIWIVPNPGDAGSSLGAAAALHGSHINWKTPYLGYNIAGNYPVKEILNNLRENKIAAVAVGRAEFGPRALGNRSIIADPRDNLIRFKVNVIKQREKFRPFAPVVLEEHASEWFDMSFTSPYMQYAVLCKQPSVIPSVVHCDGTSRVQTVNERQHAGLYRLLKEWYRETGVPVLLNTSLNIKNQPLLNDETDIDNWEKMYKCKICR